MAENENVQNPEAQQPQAQPEQDDQPVFQLQRCYLKDASLEMPHAPDILLTPQESAPQVDIQFEVSQRLLRFGILHVFVFGHFEVSFLKVAAPGRHYVSSERSKIQYQ